MGRLRRSWVLAKASWSVLRADRELLIFPLVSMVALLLVLITFAVPFVLIGGLTDPRGDYSPAAIVLGFLFYVVAYSVAFFFNTGLVGAAMIRLNGGDPTVRDGFRVALAHLPAIIGYAIVAATVGMVLRAIAERTGFIGQIVIGIVGFAWSIATFLVVPVMVVENVGPIGAIKRSGALVGKTWGEQLLGGIGIGFAMLLISLGVLAVGGVAIVALFAIAPVLGVVGIAALVVALVAVALVGSALSGIYTASLYRYATTGEAGAFGNDAMSAAFRPKSGGVKGLLGG
jgi:hypothetical protein